MFSQLALSARNRIKYVEQRLLSFILMAPTMKLQKVFADDPPAESEAGSDTLSKITSAMNEGNDAGVAISNATGFVLQVAIWAGGLILLWGAVMFAFSVKNDDPEAKQKSTYVIATGIVLLTIRTLFASIFV